jgi:hypothetical protein
VTLTDRLGGKEESASTGARGEVSKVFSFSYPLPMALRMGKTYASWPLTLEMLPLVDIVTR